ncbi:MAG: hypothetical protein IJA52_00350 [Clostridia bacterium]|nr:hypothetical protein [Clostridia bacterium]
MMNNKYITRNIHLFLVYILVLSLGLFSCNVNTSEKNDICFEIGNSINSSDLENSFLFYARCFSDSKKKVIEMLESVEYTPTDKDFGESEAVCITINGKEKIEIWYAVEYDTENVYAVFEENTYLIEDGTSLVKEIGTYLDVDKYVMFNKEYPKGFPNSYEELGNGTRICGVGTMRSPRYFYNEDIAIERIVLLEHDVLVSSTNLDMYSVAELAAKTVGIRIYDAVVFQDEKTGMWAVTVSDKERSQALQEQSEKQEGFVELAYDRWWQVIIDPSGNPLYYIKSWND